MMASNPIEQEQSEPAKAFCDCWDWQNSDPRFLNCRCGEQVNIREWQWDVDVDGGLSWIRVSSDRKEVTFHPFYSSGTAAVRGTMALEQNYHYYWEIKMLTEPYGTDIMIGCGSDKVNTLDSLFNFKSFLGRDEYTYGLSYTGAMCHNATVTQDCAGFCKGSIIGVRVDLFQGTLEFYLNREPQGIAYRDLRRHDVLYPMLCSTAANSTMRLINATSWKASLLVAAARVLASSKNAITYLENAPPGLRDTMNSMFWMTLKTKPGSYMPKAEKDSCRRSCSPKRKHWHRRW